MDGVITLSQQTRGVEYADNDPVVIMMRGTLAVIAGGAVNFRDFVRWQFGDQKWDAFTHAAASNTVTNINTALNVETGIRSLNYEAVANNGIMEISINLL